MDGCSSLIGSPSLLEAQSLTEVLERLDPQNWSLYFSPECRVVVTVNVYMVIARLLSLCGLFVALMELCSWVVSKFNWTFTPSEFQKLFGYYIASAWLFVMSFTVMRYTDSIFLQILNNLSILGFIVSFFALSVSGIELPTKNNMGKPITFAIVAISAALSLGHFFFSPHVALRTAQAKATAEMSLYVVSTLILILGILAETHVSVLTADTFKVVGKEGEDKKYVMKSGEWNLIDNRSMERV